MMADYKDYMFFSRVVDGMQKKQNLTNDIALRNQNQTLIDHIINTRQGIPVSQMPHPSTLRSSGGYRLPGNPSQSDLVSTVEDAVRLVQDLRLFEDAEELIFELEI
jgi:hypothetical protein